jgi:hypothetical protein
MIALRGGVRELMESAAELGDEALPLQPGDGGRSDAGPADFGQAGNAALTQKRASCCSWFGAPLIQFLGSFELSSEEMYHLLMLQADGSWQTVLGVLRGGTTKVCRSLIRPNIGIVGKIAG